MVMHKTQCEPDNLITPLIRTALKVIPLKLSSRTWLRLSNLPWKQTGLPKWNVSGFIINLILGFTPHVCILWKCWIDETKLSFGHTVGCGSRYAIVFLWSHALQGASSCWHTPLPFIATGSKNARRVTFQEFLRHLSNSLRSSHRAASVWLKHLRTIAGPVRMMAWDSQSPVRNTWLLAPFLSHVWIALTLFTAQACACCKQASPMLSSSAYFQADVQKIALGGSEYVRLA